MIKDRPAYANEGSFISLNAKHREHERKLREQSHDFSEEQKEIFKEECEIFPRKSSITLHIESKSPLNAFWKKRVSLILWAKKCRLGNISQFVFCFKSKIKNYDPDALNMDFSSLTRARLLNLFSLLSSKWPCIQVTDPSTLITNA